MPSDEPNDNKRMLTINGGTVVATHQVATKLYKENS